MANPRIDELRRRIEREPGSRLFAQLAEELRKDGNLAEAIRVARAGLSAHPNYPSARLTLGRALFDTGQFGPARVELEGVLRGAPDNILAARMLAECLEGLGDAGAALLQYRAAQRLSPDDKQIEAQVRGIEQRLAAGGNLRMAAPPGTRPGPPPPPSEDRPSGPAHAVAVAAGLPATPPPPPQERSPALRTVPPATPPPPLSPVVADFDDVFEPAPAWGRPPGSPGPWRDEGIVLLEDEAPTLPGAAFDRPGPAVSPPEALVAPVTLAFEAPPLLPGAETLAGAPAFVVTEAPQAPPAGPSPAHGGEATPPMAPEDGAGAPLSTPTLAELYFEQGFVGRAVEVYEQILEREPQNERVRARLIEVKALARTLEVPPQEDPRAAQRHAIQRKITRLEQMLAAVRRG